MLILSQISCTTGIARSEFSTELRSNSLCCVPLHSHPLDTVVLSNCRTDTHHRKHMSCDRYAASPLACWLLPSNSLRMNLQKTLHVTTTLCCVTSLRKRKLRGHRENTVVVLLATCVLRALPSNGFTCHNI
jgi:hypothetical protein